MEIIAITLSAICLILLVIIYLKLTKNKPETVISAIQEVLKTELKDNRSELSEALKDNRTELSSGLNNLTKSLEEKLKVITDDLNTNSKENRLEQNKSLKTFEDTFKESVKEFNNLQKQKFEEMNLKQTELVKTTELKLAQIIEGLNKSAKDNREELTQALKSFSDTFSKNVKEFNDLQKQKFDAMTINQNELIKNTETKLESIRVTVEEKLEKTLSERLGQSFETVGKQLIEVQKGLGEMQTIAADVGGLKKVLSNVKLRGGVGEVQLAMLLEQILAPNQYEANVKTKKGSSDSVEFAIKLPGRSEDEGSVVYLPIDAKFPKDTYEHLINAYESAIPEDIEAASKKLEITIRKMAKDIRDKYIDPPNTTDFAILFLPFESIYAEVIRRSALVDQLRDEYKIAVAGPTTLMAILNSLQMGFRTLSLQKRSSEVWKVLSTVKTEFGKFGGLLEKAQKNIQTGMGQLDDVIGTRTRAIQRQLRDVEKSPAVDANNILTEIIDESLDGELEN